MAADGSTGKDRPICVSARSGNLALSWNWIDRPGSGSSTGRAARGVARRCCPLRVPARSGPAWRPDSGQVLMLRLEIKKPGQKIDAAIARREADELQAPYWLGLSGTSARRPSPSCGPGSNRSAAWQHRLAGRRRSGRQGRPLRPAWPDLPAPKTTSGGDGYAEPPHVQRVCGRGASA